MEIIEPSFEIITPIDKNYIYQLIERAGRVCYKSEAKNPLKDPAITATFIKKIINMKHLSVLEHFSISVCFVTDRGISHELVRHRLASYSQESTRYCDFSKKGMTFIKPLWVDNDVINGFFYFAESITSAYERMLGAGHSPQQARDILPNCLKTELIMTANLREWRHVLELRTSSAAHPEMRRIMIPLLAEFKKLLPEIFEDVNV